MSLTRIVRRNIDRFTGPLHPFDPRMAPKKRGITITSETMPTGEPVYTANGVVIYHHPYVCAVRRKPYNGNSDRMRGGS